MPGYDVQLRDVDGEPVPDGTPGSLFVRGESMAIGYWRRTDATRTVFQGEWLSTGDTYVRSADGYFTCLGRSNDLIKAGGIWVSPTEVEARAPPARVGPRGRRHRGARRRRSRQAGRRVVLVPGATVTAEELIAFAREGLAAFKAPRRVVVVADLPKTATGKMQRFQVRELSQRRPADRAGGARRARRAATEPVEPAGAAT